MIAAKLPQFPNASVWWCLSCPVRHTKSCNELMICICFVWAWKSAHYAWGSNTVGNFFFWFIIHKNVEVMVWYGLLCSLFTSLFVEVGGWRLREKSSLYILGQFQRLVEKPFMFLQFLFWMFILWSPTQGEKSSHFPTPRFCPCPSSLPSQSCHTIFLDCNQMFEHSWIALERKFPHV